MSCKKLNIVGANNDGSKLYCIFKLNKKTVLRGFYDFNIQGFIITKFHKKNFNQNTSINKVVNALKKELNLEYDWKLFDNNDK